MKKEYRKKDYTQGHLRQLIVRKKGSGLTHREVAEELGIGSTRTVWKWVNNNSLESKSSAPKKPKRVYTLLQIYALYALRRYRDLSIDNCKDMLEEEYSVNMSRSLIWNYLKYWWFTKKKKRVTKKFKEYDPWYIHIDISYGPKFNWKKYYIYVAIDRATRLMNIEVHTDKKANTAAEFLKKSIKFFPFEIEKILTDNWREFTLKNHLWKTDLEWVFDKICKEFMIEHRLTKPRHPRTNWMVEKVNDTIKSNTVWITEYKNAEQMINDISSFMIYYNIYRRHGSLVKEKKGKRPYDALCYYYKTMPEIFTETPENFKKKLLDMKNKNTQSKHKKRNM